MKADGGNYEGIELALSVVESSFLRRWKIFWSDMRTSPSKLSAVSLLFLTACVTEQPHYVFDTGNLSEKDWAHMRKECDYEASKATASAPVNIAFYRWEEL